MKVLEIISAIEADKATRHIWPTHALVNEVITQYPAGREELKALEKNGGKRKLAASELGISERTLYRKIKEYGLE